LTGTLLGKLIAEIGLEEFQKRDACFGLDDAFHHDLAGSIPDGNRNTFLVYIQTDLFNVASHKRAFRIGLLPKAVLAAASLQ